MAKIIKNGRLQQKIDTEANWIANDPVILAGEICVATNIDGKDNKQVKIKIANVDSKWSEVSYLNTGGAGGGVTIDHYDDYESLPTGQNTGAIGIVDSETVLDFGETTLYPKGTFRLPTSAEYVYMLDTRVDAHDRRFRATLTDLLDDGEKGLIVLPDTFDLTLISEYAEDSYGKLLTLKQFKEIETLGASFLPCGGNIRNGEFHNPDIYVLQKANISGWYWTSTRDSWARALMNNPGEEIVGNDYWHTYFPLSVRLVQDCEATDICAIKVGEDKYFKFSPGNLQYEIETQKYYFAENQWDILGEANITACKGGSGKVDLMQYASSGYEGTTPLSGSTVNIDITGTEYDAGIHNEITYQTKDVRVYKPGSAFMYSEDTMKWEPLSGYDTEEETTIVSRVGVLEKGKVDKEEGKGLSTNDYSDEEKAKLASITTPMQVKGRVDTVEDLPESNVEVGWVYLVGAEGSENFEEYVCTEVDESTGAPTWEGLGPATFTQKQVDWNENDSTKEEYVKNRTHWEEEAELTLVELENVHGNYTYFDFSEPIVAGETYTMIASGFSPDTLNTSETVIAESPLGGTDVQIRNSNGLSFIQREVPPAEAEGKHGQFNGPTGGNVTLIKQASIVHQLDPKYVPITDFVYVDKTNGDDENNGSYNLPVKTLAKGVELSNIEPRKYIKFKDNGEIHIESPSSDNEYKFVENVDFRLMTDSSQTICFDKGFYNIKKEFKVRGAGNFTNVDENNANYPLAYNKSNIDIDVTGDVTFDGYWFTKFDNVADLDSIISIKCKTFDSNFHFSNSVIPEANSYLLNNVWPSISIDADKVISRQTGAPLYKVKIKANKFEVAEKENEYFAPIQAYYLDLDIKEFYAPDCAWSGSDVTYKINLFKLEANYNSTYCQTNNIHSYLDLPMSKMKIGKLSLPKLTKSGSLSEQKFCMFNFDSSTTYSDYVIAPYLDLQIDTLDLTRTFSGNVHYGLYDIYANGSTIIGNCNSILLPESSNAAQKMIYPWDFQWYRPINYNISKDPVDNFRWNFQTSPVDIYVDFGAPATGNDGRSKEHPISSMSELKKAFDLATSGIKIHVMSGSSHGIYAGDATSLGLDFSAITPTTATKHISIVGEFSNSEIRIYGLKVNASLEIFNFKDVYLSNCYFPTNTLDATNGIVNIHNVVQLYVDNCKFHSLSTIKCCKFYDNGGNDYASSFSLNADEIQNIAIAGGDAGNSVMPGTVKINCNGDINNMSINKNGGKVDVFANGCINITNDASSQVELNITGTNNVKFTQRGESSNLKLKVESTSNILDIISYNATSYSDSNIIRNSEILFKGKDVETDSTYPAGLPLWFYSSYVSINAEKNFYDRGYSQYYTKLFIDGQTRLKIDADWIEWNQDYTGYTSMSSGLYTSQYQYLELNAHRVNFDWKNAVYQQLIINADEVVFNNFGGNHYCHEYIWNIGTLTVNHATESCGWFELMDYNVNTTFCAEQLLTRNDLPISKINVDHIINNRQSYGNPSQPLFYVNMMASYTHPTRKYPDDSSYTVFLGCRLHLNVGVYEMPKLSYYGPASSSYKKLVGTSGAPGCEVSGACQHVSIGGMQNETAKQWMWDLQSPDLTDYIGSATSKYNDQNSFNFYYTEYTNWCDYYIDFMIGSDANSGHDEQHPMKTFAGLIQKYNWNNSSNSLPMMRLHIGTPTTSFVLSEAQSSSARIILDFTNVYTQCIEIVGLPEMSDCVIQGLSNSSICYIHDFKHLYLDNCTFRGSSKISAINNLYLYNCTLAGNISVDTNQLQQWGGISSDDYYSTSDVTYEKATAIEGFCRINGGGNGSYIGFKSEQITGNNQAQFTVNFDGYASDVRLYNLRNGRIDITAQEIHNLHDYGCCNCYLTAKTTSGNLYYYQHDPDTTVETGYQVLNGRKHIISSEDIYWNGDSSNQNLSIFKQYLKFDCNGYFYTSNYLTIYNSELVVNAKLGASFGNFKLDNHYSNEYTSLTVNSDGDFSCPQINGGGNNNTINVFANCKNCYISQGTYYYGYFNINATNNVTLGANHTQNTFKIVSGGDVQATGGSFYKSSYDISSVGSINLGGSQTKITATLDTDNNVTFNNGGFSGCNFTKVTARKNIDLNGGWNLYTENNSTEGNYLYAECYQFYSYSFGTSGADNFYINCNTWVPSGSTTFKTWTTYAGLGSSFVLVADNVKISSYPYLTLEVPKWKTNPSTGSDNSWLKEFRLKFNKINYYGSESGNPFIWISGNDGSSSSGSSGYIDCDLEIDFGTSEPGIDFARILGTYLMQCMMPYKIVPEYFSTDINHVSIFKATQNAYSGSVLGNTYYSFGGPVMPSNENMVIGEEYYLRIGAFDFGPLVYRNVKGSSGYTMLGDISEMFSYSYIPDGYAGEPGVGCIWMSSNNGQVYIKQSLLENYYYHSESMYHVPSINLSGDTTYIIEIYQKKEVIQKLPKKYITTPDYSDSDEKSYGFIKNRPAYTEKGYAVLGFSHSRLMRSSWSNSTFYQYGFYNFPNKQDLITIGSTYRMIYDGKDLGLFKAYGNDYAIYIGSSFPRMAYYEMDPGIGIYMYTYQTNNPVPYVHISDELYDPTKLHSFELYLVNENIPNNLVYNTLDYNLLGIDGNKINPKAIYVWNDGYPAPYYVSDGNQGTNIDQPLLTFTRACQLLNEYGDDCFIHFIGNNKTISLDNLYNSYKIHFENEKIRIYLDSGQTLQFLGSLICVKDFIIRGEGNVNLSETGSDFFALRLGAKLDIDVAGDVTFVKNTGYASLYNNQYDTNIDGYCLLTQNPILPLGNESISIKCNKLYWGCYTGQQNVTTSNFTFNADPTIVTTELVSKTSYSSKSGSRPYVYTYNGDYSGLLSELVNGATYYIEWATSYSDYAVYSSSTKTLSFKSSSSNYIVVSASSLKYNTYGNYSNGNLRLVISSTTVTDTKHSITCDIRSLVGNEFNIDGSYYTLASADYNEYTQISDIIWSPNYLTSNLSYSASFDTFYSKKCLLPYDIKCNEFIDISTQGAGLSPADNLNTFYASEFTLVTNKYTKNTTSIPTMLISNVFDIKIGELIINDGYYPTFVQSQRICRQMDPNTPVPEYAKKMSIAKIDKITYDCDNISEFKYTPILASDNEYYAQPIFSTDNTYNQTWDIEVGSVVLPSNLTQDRIYYHYLPAIYYPCNTSNVSNHTAIGVVNNFVNQLNLLNNWYSVNDTNKDNVEWTNYIISKADNVEVISNSDIDDVLSSI